MQFTSTQKTYSRLVPDRGPGDADVVAAGAGAVLLVAIHRMRGGYMLSKLYQD